MVDCKRCLERLDEIKDTTIGGASRSGLYAVGNRARDDMGHAMYFTSDGRTALCAAKRITAENN